MDYPNEFIRGVLNDDDMIGEYPDASLFKKFDIVDGRDDGYSELSINWNDCEEALLHILEQRKENGSLQYSSGAAIFSRIELDRLCKKNTLARNNLSYERREVEGNIYHGNLLLRKELTEKKERKKRDMIAAVIAMYCFKRMENIK